MALPNEITRRLAVIEGINYRLYPAGRKRSGSWESGPYQRLGNPWQQDNCSQRHKQVRQNLQDKPRCQLKHGRPPKSLSGFVVNGHFKRPFIIQTTVLGRIMAGRGGPNFWGKVAICP